MRFCTFSACVRREGSRIIAVIAAVAGVASLHNLLIRPAVMQTVYPALGLFMLALLSVLRFPKKKSAYIALGATAVLAFYFYPHLWIAAFTAIGLLVLWSLLRRDKASLKFLLPMRLGIAIACLPQIYNILSLFTIESAQELNLRVGLVHTHTVLPLTITNMKYTFVLVGCLVILAVRRKLSAAEKLILLLGASLLIASMSNVITGREMDFYSHYWRLGLLLNVVAIATFIPTLMKEKAVATRLLLGFCTFALLFTTVNRTFVRINSYRYLRYPERELALARSIQEYENVFKYFNNEGITNQVILSHGHLGQYIPLYTRNYVFYIARAWLHVIPNSELLTRFLTFHVDDIDSDFLKENVRDYAGMSPEHTAWYANAYTYKMEPIDVIGGEEFIEATLKKHEEIRQSYDETLERFHVTYAVFDKERSDNPQLPAAKTVVMEDERFTVYRLD